ncbi:MAG TPA: S41 family peptidase [Polyangiaceae bacterium]
MRLRIGIGLLVVAALGGIAAVSLHDTPHPVVAAAASVAITPPDAGKAPVEDEDRSPSLRPPTGKLASLTCAQAATIVKEVEDELAFVPARPSNAAMAGAVRDWVDPHGHWAASQDATPWAAIDADAGALVGEITQGTSCPASMRIGKKLATWVDAQRARYDARVAVAAAGDEKRALADALDVAARDGGTAPLTAVALTDELADRAGALKRAFGEPLTKYLQDARNRYFPEMTADAWSEVVLAAAVRGWVEEVDAHGAWAPYGEEAAVHDVDLDQDAPSRLWTRATRTLIGVRVDDGALAPLASGDVILEVDGMPLAGLGVEQLDELALTAADGDAPFDVVLMREGDRAPRTVRVEESDDAPAVPAATAHPFDLATEMVAYGSGQVAVVTIPDIYDDLGELFSRALLRARSPKLAGIVLDLRGNGGGSTEGAIDTIGAFLPGARLFPMINRRGTIEIDRAPAPPPDEQWSGPVATLVDSGTASAAEMLAGALAAYRRGPTVGAPTYGKGCAQEYLDDDAHAGLLRVTTLLFALPDGSPVQHVGLTPMIAFPFRDVDGEREAKLDHSPGAWSGPDVRDRAWVSKAAQFAWPQARVGPCKDAALCKALALLGEPRASKIVARKSEVRQ